MEVWIARNGKSYGPYEEQDIKQWIADGKISADDLAFKDGESSWVPLSQILKIKPEAGGGRGNAYSSRGARSSTQAPPYASNPSEKLHGNAQRPASSMPDCIRAPHLYAGFWMRVVAYFLDFVIAVVSGGVLGAITGLLLGAFISVEGIRAVSIVIGLTWGWLYFALSESSSWQATPGKLALGLLVVDQYGKRIGFGRATGRYFAKIISGLTLLIGYMMAGWTIRKQTLHDLMAGAYVVKKTGLQELDQRNDSHDA